MFVRALYSGAHDKLNEFYTKTVLTLLEGLHVSKILFVLAICLFKMKLTISKRVQAQGVLYPITRQYHVSSLIRSALGLSSSQIVMRQAVFVSQYPLIECLRRDLLPNRKLV